MKTQAVLRKIHNRDSLCILFQMGIVIGAGVFLQLKKEMDRIQPPTMKGVAQSDVPTQSIADMFETAKATPALEISDWRDLARVDVKPGKGVVKFIAVNNWEAQADMAKGDALQVSYRRNDSIERLHDGSFYADRGKLYLLFPSALILLVLWATGVYLFFLPHVKRAMKNKNGARSFAPQQPSSNTAIQN